MSTRPMLPPPELDELLKRAFPDAETAITDLTGTQDHYQVRIVSAAFEGKPHLARHRLVYSALGVAMAGPIHALSLNALAPSEV